MSCRARWSGSYTSAVQMQRLIVGVDAAADGLDCSFCDRMPSEGGTLIVSGDVAICDYCIAEGAELVAQEPALPDEDAHEEADPAAVVGARQHQPVFFRLLTEADVATLLPAGQLIDAMRIALMQFSAGKVTQPVRTVIPMGQDRSFLGLMPAYLREAGSAGAKLVAVFPGNAQRNLPTHLASILLISPETGALISMMDGRYITEARTAAVSAVSAVALARDDAGTLAILGSGTQARSHLTMLQQVFSLQEVRVWSPTPDHAAAFVDEMQPSAKAPIVQARSAEAAVRGADLIVLATSSPEPVIRNAWVADGAHVMAVGACRPDQREMDPQLVARGRLFVDSRDAALVESGDVVMGIAEGTFGASHVIGELGALLAGSLTGRQWPNDVTIVKSLGLAVEDVVAARLVYDRAIAGGIGQELEL